MLRTVTTTDGRGYVIGRMKDGRLMVALIGKSRPSDGHRVQGLGPQAKLGVYKLNELQERSE